MPETTASNSDGQLDPQPRGFRIGPGFLVTAAFIGPGTVTAATLAGFGHGLTLLWVVALSTLAAIVLQEMAGRIGLVRREPLGQVLRESTRPAALRVGLSALIFLAILFGNTAYQSGNLLGAVKGLDLLSGGRVFDSVGFAIVVLTLFALLAGGLLATGNPRLVSRFLIALVVLMSLLFLGIAIRVCPSAAEFSRAAVPRIPVGGAATTLALFGTTIVPYNLFLYASLVGEKWPSKIPTARALRESRIDITLAVGLGGLVTAAILVTGAAAMGTGDTLDFNQLPDRLGKFVAPEVSRSLLGLGLLGAGLSSAITAPMAASYAAAGIFGWPSTLRSPRNRLVSLVVLLSGWAVAAAGILWGVRPEQAILLAQAANGLILPVLALLLWWLVARRQIMGEFVNGRVAQVASFLVVFAISIVWLVSLILKLSAKLG